MLIRMRELSANVKTQFWDKSSLVLFKSLKPCLKSILLEIYTLKNVP